MSHWPALEEFCKKHNLGFLPIRFRLRTLLFMTTLLAVVLGFAGNVLIHIRRQSAIADRIGGVDGSIYFQNYLGTVYGTAVDRDEWLRKHFGEHTFRHIKHVHLQAIRPNDEVLALMPRLPRLEALQVSGKAFTAENLRSVLQCRSLQTLEIHLSGTESCSLAELRQLPKLRQLILAELGVAQLRDAATIPQLERLTIRSRHTTPAVLAELKKLPNLQQLAIYGCVDPDHETCSALSGLDRLELLSLSDVPLNANDYRQLARLPSMRRLAVSPTSDLDLESAAVLQQMSKLQLLRVGNGCTDEMLVKFAGLPELETLNLSDAVITDASVPALLRFPKLKSLVMNKSLITMTGLRKLVQDGQFQQLGPGSKLTSEEAQELRKISQLKGRYLSIMP